MQLSVILPVYNGERYLTEAIASVRQQAFSSMEIIVVNDGSTDGTATILQDMASDPQIRIFHQSNQGCAAARNHGLQKARGELISFIDADDLWAEDKLRCQLPVLEANRRIQLVMGWVQRLVPSNGDGRDAARFRLDGSPRRELLLGCMVCRREVFVQIGDFDTSLTIGEDTDWFLRVRMAEVPAITVDQVTLLYRRHTESLTAGIDHTRTTIFPVLQRALRRHRGEAGTHISGSEQHD